MQNRFLIFAPLLNLFVDKADNVYITDNLAQLRLKLKTAVKNIECVSRVYTLYGNSLRILDPCMVHIQYKISNVGIVFHIIRDCS